MVVKELKGFFFISNGQGTVRQVILYTDSLVLPYFFGYKTELFSFQNNPKDLDPSCNRSILQDGSRSLGLFRKGGIGIIAKFHRTELVIRSHSRGTKTPSYSQINTVL